MELIITKFNNKTGDFQTLIPVPYEASDIRSCTEIDSKYEMTEDYNCFDLIRENQKLRKQLDEDKNRYRNHLYNQLAEDVEPDPEDFYLAEIEGKANDYDKLEKENQELKKKLETCFCNRDDCAGRIKDSKTFDSLEQKVERQQKEFIEYLENKIKEAENTIEMLADTVSHRIPDLQLKRKLLKEILSKYKEIVGVKDE